MRVDENHLFGWVYSRQRNGLETSWKDFEREFGPWDTRKLSKSGNAAIAKQTFLNYKKQLESTGKLQKRLSSKTKRPVYYVPEEHRQEAELACTFSELRQTLVSNSLSAFDRELKRMLREQVIPQVVSATVDHVWRKLIKEGCKEAAGKLDRQEIMSKMKVDIVLIDSSAGAEHQSLRSRREEDKHG